MTDGLERLRAANPVPECPAPEIEPVWAQIDRSETRDGGRRWLLGLTVDRVGRHRRASSLAVGGLLAGALVVALLAFAGGNGGGLGIVDRAYAAINTDGVVVHYVVQTTVHPARSSGASFQYSQSVDEVWISGSRSHSVGALYFISSGRRSPPLPVERVVDGTKVVLYQAGTIFVDRQGPTKSCPSITACGPGALTDPVLELHHLSKTRVLVSAGETRFNGRRVAVLAAVSRAAHLGVLVDPRSGVPLQITESGSRPWPADPTSTTTITHYERLPLTARTRQLLQMHPHPGAHVLPQTGRARTSVTAHQAFSSSPVAQIHLTPATHSSAAGVAIITRYRRRDFVSISASGIAPLGRHLAYAVWLTRGSSRAKLLGFFNPAPDRHHRLSTKGQLPTGAAQYHQLLITRETSPNPGRPGTPILEGNGTL